MKTFYDETRTTYLKHMDGAKRKEREDTMAMIRKHSAVGVIEIEMISHPLQEELGHAGFAVKTIMTGANEECVRISWK